MATPDAIPPAQASERPLTADSLVRDFGSRTALAREGVAVLHDALQSATPEALAGWRAVFGDWAGRAMDRVPQHLARLARQYGVSAAGGDTFLFALQTYYALMVSLVARRLVGNHSNDLLPGNPFSWYATARSDAIRAMVDRLGAALAECRLAAPGYSSGDCDLFKQLYQDLLPRPLRHALGEYYTPDWLAAHVLDQVGYTGQRDARLLDPACGSGTFLLMAIRRWRLGGGGRETGDEGRRTHTTLDASYGMWDSAITDLSPAPRLPSPAPTFPIVGFDLNPLAVLTARANYLIAVADMLPPDGRVEAPVYVCDSILGVPTLPCAATQFDYVVGNPPWIAWDNLPDDDRQATKPLWERYGLFSLGGNEARHGGGKKDLSMLMLYAAADRYLKPQGRLGMVITQTLFQSKGAGDGFRRFQLGPDGPPLRVLRVDDMTAMRPFDDAANWTSTIVLQKGEATEYPVQYVKWTEEGREERGEGRGNDECGMMNDECQASTTASHTELSIHHSSFIIHHSCLARPIDPARPNSPWLVLPADRARDHALAIGPADYTAHLGANSGGANGVYWVEILSEWHATDDAGRGTRDGGRGTGDGGRGTRDGEESNSLPSPFGRGAGGEGDRIITDLDQCQSALTLTLSQRERGLSAFHAPSPAPRPQSLVPRPPPPALLSVRNVAARGKHRIETIERTIEADLLYPLLRWSDVRRWSAVPRGYILLTQDPAARTGVNEALMRDRYPRTLEYLQQFSELLESRAAYRRYQGAGPFYSMYNVGPYTMAPIKVVWRRMDRQINAAVVEEVDDPRLGRRPVIPQETCVLVVCESADEAHYLCASLNSTEVNELVSAHSVRGGKGFGTPSMLDFIPLRRFDPGDPRHIELAALSRRAHATAAKGG